MNRNSWLLIVLVVVVALLPRILDLDAFLSPDEPRWLSNTENFLMGLETGELSHLYQQPHPGITTMWLAAPVVNSESWAVRRLPVAVVISLLIGASTYLMMQLWGRRIGVAAGLLLAMNPIFIAHSRVLAMDALLSIFLLLSILLLLNWQKDWQRRWLIISAVAGSLALFSKMIGVLMLPFAFFFAVHLLVSRQRSLRNILKDGALWLSVFILTSIIVLPTILTDFDRVYEGTVQFFTTEHYSQAVHALGPLWYPQALLLWTTPLHLLATLAIPFALLFKNRYRSPIIAISGFLILFFLAVQYSIKKGDRYLLPDFIIFDVVAVLLFFAAGQVIVEHWKKPNKKWRITSIALVIIGIAFIWQVIDVAKLHPHALAYRNPFFREVARGRTMGWGEGLDVAAKYLNQKPNAQNLYVASYYEHPFELHFVGKVTPAERLASETLEQIGADYVVLYRTMQGRAPDRWETKILAQFESKVPEHIITLNGEEYVWIYNTQR